jgi:hypothetical protein
MSRYVFVNQSWRWGRPGALISDAELPIGVPVPGTLEEGENHDSEFAYFYFRRRDDAGTYIMRFSEPQGYYAPVDGEPARVYCWCGTREAMGAGFIYFRPGAKVRYKPYRRNAALRVLTERGVQAYNPGATRPVVL